MGDPAFKAGSVSDQDVIREALEPALAALGSLVARQQELEAERDEAKRVGTAFYLDQKHRAEAAEARLAEAERERDEAQADAYRAREEVTQAQVREDNAWTRLGDQTELQARLRLTEQALREIAADTSISGEIARVVARAALDAQPAEECVCGEINTRHCPVHALPAAQRSRREA